MLFSFFFFFFFSSRRRHTRFDCDWSSDVCSSDLIAAESQRLINETYSAFLQGFMPSLGRPEVDLLSGLTTAIIVDQERMGANRSEERRVGKECRSRWSPYH